MRYVILFYLISAVHFSHGGDPKYPVSQIPEALKKDVNAVFRVDESVFTILAKNKATHYVHKVVTIFNENGQDHAIEVIGYDKLTKIKDFNAFAYDASGKVIKKLKNSEIYDQSAFDGYSLYSDARLKAANMSQGTYPYTVEFEYEIEYNYLFHIPGFVVVPEEKLSVENSKYTLIYPPDLAPRYHTRNVENKPVSNDMPGGQKSLTWSFHHVPAIKREPHSPLYSALSLIEAAPSQFQFDAYEGSMKSWDSFGSWISSLNKGRDILPESTKQKIKEIADKHPGTEEKVKAVYEFLQNKTRYVSIQLGIGGYQPFPAEVVDKTGYGDCKALSNYMVAMLKSIGIPSHYVLIRAGENKPLMDVDFPGSQFNHAVVAVPNNGDTLWLECTSQTNPFAYAGLFTGNRKALLITENGAAIASTPYYGAAENTQIRKAEVILGKDGHATANVVTQYSGLQYENDNLNFLLNNQYDEQKKWIQRNTNIPTFDLIRFSMREEKSRIPVATVTLELALNRLANVSGKRVFLTPNLMNRNSYIPEKVESRKSPVHRSLAFTDIDTIRYRIPEEIYPEFLPDPVRIQNRFGEYESSFTVDQGTLVYVRRIKMNDGYFPPESYNELIEFYRSITKSDNTKIVFLSKT